MNELSHDLFGGESVPAQFHLRLYTAQTRTIDESWDSRDVYSSYWRLYANESAGGRLHLEDGTMHALDPGAFHLVPAWTRFSCEADASIVHRFAHFELVGLVPEVSRSVFRAPVKIAMAPGFGFAAETGPVSIGNGSPSCASPASALRVKAICYHALAHAFAALGPADLELLARYGRARESVSRALEHIERHLAGRLSVGDLADLCGFSVDHFIRRFRQAIGQTPAAYVTDRRVSTASQLLVFTNLTIDEIAERVGYRNRYYFSRVFSQTMGTPPGRYRRIVV